MSTTTVKQISILVPTPTTEMTSSQNYQKSLTTYVNGLDTQVETDCTNLSTANQKTAIDKLNYGIFFPGFYDPSALPYSDATPDAGPVGSIYDAFQSLIESLTLQFQSNQISQQTTGINTDYAGLTMEISTYASDSQTAGTSLNTAANDSVVFAGSVANANLIAGNEEDVASNAGTGTEYVDVVKSFVNILNAANTVAGSQCSAIEGYALDSTKLAASVAELNSISATLVNALTSAVASTGTVFADFQSMYNAAYANLNTVVGSAVTSQTTMITDKSASDLSQVKFNSDLTGDNSVRTTIGKNAAPIPLACAPTITATGQGTAGNPSKSTSAKTTTKKK